MQQPVSKMQVETLEILEDGGALAMQPNAILKLWKKRNKAEVLVHWKGLASKDATWEKVEDLKLCYLEMDHEDEFLRWGDVL